MNKDRALTDGGFWNPPAAGQWARSAKSKRKRNLKRWVAKKGQRNKWALSKGRQG